MLAALLIFGGVSLGLYTSEACFNYILYKFSLIIFRLYNKQSFFKLKKFTVRELALCKAFKSTLLTTMIVALKNKEH